jgi:mono/diheme cytochrome c family protein
MKRIALFAVAGATLGALVAALAIHTPSNSPAFAAAPDGKAIFATNCATCHGDKGQGAENVAPPLAKNSYETGDPKKVIHTVLYGLSGPIKVNGKPWGDGTMPAWKGSLTNAQIAAVITFERSSWGNKASAVTEKQVASVKK